MNTTQTLYHEGDRFCRPTTGWDVAKFFFFNFGLHAVTVITEPGSTLLATIQASLLSILLPSFAVMRAFDVLSCFSVKGGTSLEVAFRSGALCMLMPASYGFTTRGSPTAAGDGQVTARSAQEGGSKLAPEGSTYPVMGPFDRRSPRERLVPVALHMTEVHGEYPQSRLVLPLLFSKNNDSNEESISESHQIGLIEVPPWFEVYPISRPRRTENRWEVIKKWLKRRLPNSKGDSAEDSMRNNGPNLACNFNLIKSFAAISQILYGSFELYQTGKDQLSQYGRYSYQLTVTPYVVMSLVNLVAGLTSPQYPMRYLVHYRGVRPLTEQEATQKAEGEYPGGWWDREERIEIEGQTSGAVGLVYGNFLDEAERSRSPERCAVRYGKLELPRSRVFEPLSPYIASILLMLPYFIIFKCLNLGVGESTRSQRSWMGMWLWAATIAGGSTVGLYRRRFSPILRARYPKGELAIFTAFTLILATGSFGGFVIIAQMMLRSITCQSL